jgi:hypothetical protein
VSARPPYLVPVPADGAVPQYPPAPPAAGRPARVQVSAWQRAEIEDARRLVMETGELLGARPHAYVAGLLEGACSNLLDILDTITSPEGAL